MRISRGGCRRPFLLRGYAAGTVTRKVLKVWKDEGSFKALLVYEPAGFCFAQSFDQSNKRITETEDKNQDVT